MYLPNIHNNNDNNSVVYYNISAYDTHAYIIIIIAYQYTETQMNELRAPRVYY